MTPQLMNRQEIEATSRLVKLIMYVRQFVEVNSIFFHYNGAMRICASIRYSINTLESTFDKIRVYSWQTSLEVKKPVLSDNTIMGSKLYYTQ